MEQTAQIKTRMATWNGRAARRILHQYGNTFLVEVAGVVRVLGVVSVLFLDILGGEEGSVCTDISFTERRCDTGGTGIAVFLVGIGGKYDN